MDQGKIKINFLPISRQEFSFTIFRREYRQERKEGVFENLIRKSLPVDSNVDIHSHENRKDYWISFEERTGFDKFTCHQDYNTQLTIHFLFLRLLEKTKNELKVEEYVLPLSPFRKVVFFILQKYLAGDQVVWLEPYCLQPAHKLGFLLDFKFQKKQGVLFSRDVQKLSLSLDKDFKSNRNFYIDKRQKIDDFLAKFRKRLFPLSIANLEIDIIEQLESLDPESLSTKQYIFADNKTDNSQFRGVEKYGPLTKLNSNVQLVGIFRERDKYFFDDLINALQGKSYGVAFKGFEKMFRFNIIQPVENVLIPDLSHGSLDSALEKVLSVKAQRGNPTIPIFIGDKENDDAYFYLKYKLLKESIPAQVVTLDLLRKKEALKWSISNIALQIFAKLGGQPWKVVPSNEKCVIFGIGQAHQWKDGKIVKHYAYSVCTDSSGIYKRVNVLGNSESEATYLEQLRQNMITTVREYVGSGYQSCVLHIPFRIKRNELVVINEVLKMITDSKGDGAVEFVVLKVNSDNKFFGYASTNSLVPYESTYVIVSNSPKSYLVWFEGLQYHRETIFKRVGGPTYVEFYWSSKELQEQERVRYLQDLLNLSGANWRGFNAKSLPISIYYCQLIADFIMKFPEEVANIGNIPAPWFL